MAGAVVARGDQGLVNRPGAFGRVAAFLQHGAHLFCGLGDLGRRLADDHLLHQGGGGLAERAGAHFLAVIGHHAVLHLQVDLHPAAAQRAGDRDAGVRVFQPVLFGQAAGQGKNAVVV